MPYNSVGKTEAAANIGQLSKTNEKETKKSDLTMLFTAISENIDNIELSFISTVKNLDSLEAQKAKAADDTSLTPKEAQQKVDEINEQIASLKNEIDTLTKELKAKRNTLQTKQDSLDNLQQDYKTALSRVKSKNDRFDKITDKITSTLDELEKDTEKERDKAVKKAEKQYNADEDGNWDEYLVKILKDVSPNLGLRLKLQGLATQSEVLTRELNTQQSSLFSQSDEITSLQKSISSLKTSLNSTADEIKEKNTTIEDLNKELQTIIPSMISKEEWDIVDEYEINLSEKLADGSARYIFAKGSSDNQYHIFDVNQDECFYESIVRKYIEDIDKSYEIIPSGSGRIYKDDFNKGEGEQSTVYYLDESGYVQDKACFQTCSPLSFDITGEKVSTSNEIVSFDIDGDGIVDRINDSNNGVLVFDKDGDGVSGVDGSECFGDNTDLDGDGCADGYKNGFEALLALAQKANLVNDEDLTLDENDIEILEQNYGLKMKKDGYKSETVSLKEVGITEINLSNNETKLAKNFDNKGNDLMTQNGATFKIDDETREYADLWHKKIEDENENQNGEFVENPLEGINDTTFVNTDNTNIVNKITTTKNAARKMINKVNQKIKEYYKKL